MEISKTINPKKLNPPFPNNVTSAPLLRVSLSKLLKYDEEESQHLYAACKDLGFFYLDLQDSSKGQSILEDANKLFNVGEELFDLNLEDKRSYDFSEQKSYFGYGTR